jgi:hypothetical protein
LPLCFKLTDPSVAASRKDWSTRGGQMRSRCPWPGERGPRPNPQEPLLGRAARCPGPPILARPIRRPGAALNDVSSTRVAVCMSRGGRSLPICDSVRWHRALQRVRSSRESDAASGPLAGYAARFSETIGRCSTPPTRATASVNRSPGCPAMSVRGPAHGAQRGQRLRGSMRGRRFAGRNRR